MRRIITPAVIIILGFWLAAYAPICVFTTWNPVQKRCTPDAELINDVCAKKRFDFCE